MYAVRYWAAKVCRKNRGDMLLMVCRCQRLVLPGVWTDL